MKALRLNSDVLRFIKPKRYFNDGSFDGEKVYKYNIQPRGTGKKYYLDTLYNKIKEFSKGGLHQ